MMLSSSRSGAATDGETWRDRQESNSPENLQGDGKARRRILYPSEVVWDVRSQR